MLISLKKWRPGASLVGSHYQSDTIIFPQTPHLRPAWLTPLSHLAQPHLHGAQWITLTPRSWLFKSKSRQSHARHGVWLAKTALVKQLWLFPVNKIQLSTTLTTLCWYQVQQVRNKRAQMEKGKLNSWVTSSFIPLSSNEIENIQQRQVNFLLEWVILDSMMQCMWE